jgi:hypothetical protein
MKSAAGTDLLSSQVVSRGLSHFHHGRVLALGFSSFSALENGARLTGLGRRHPSFEIAVIPKFFALGTGVGAHKLRLTLRRSGQPAAAAELKR